MAYTPPLTLAMGDVIPAHQLSEMNVQQLLPRTLPFAWMLSMFDDQAFLSRWYVLYKVDFPGFLSTPSG